MSGLTVLGTSSSCRKISESFDFGEKVINLGERGDEVVDREAGDEAAPALLVQGDGLSFLFAACSLSALDRELVELDDFGDRVIDFAEREYDELDLAERGDVDSESAEVGERGPATLLALEDGLSHSLN
jgi:hypothetical protein